MALQKLRYLLATSVDFLIIFFAINLIVDMKYGFEIFIIFGFLVPIRIIMVATLVDVSIKKKLLSLFSALLIFMLAIYWGHNNENWILYLIIVIASVDFIRDLKNTIFVSRRE